MNYLEMLARLGVGNAHPGGHTATLEQLERFPIPAGSRVLEVGCGTGRTACLLAKRGCRVTASDVREDMLVKAKRRAEAEGADVEWVKADVCRLPFDAARFDVVLAESVTVFTHIDSAIREYARVMAPGGELYDRELVALKPLNGRAARELDRFYGIRKLPGESDWLHILASEGFGEASMWNLSPFADNMWEDAVRHPDHQQRADVGAYTDPGLWQTAARYSEFMRMYRDYVGYGLLVAKKQAAAAR